MPRMLPTAWHRGQRPFVRLPSEVASKQRARQKSSRSERGTGQKAGRVRAGEEREASRLRNIFGVLLFAVSDNWVHLSGIHGKPLHLFVEFLNAHPLQWNKCSRDSVSIWSGVY